MIVKYLIVLFFILQTNGSILPRVMPKIDQNVSNCFAKIRTLASMNSSFRTALDTVAKSSRIDSIIKVLMSRVDEVCTQHEKDYVINYFDKHRQAVGITESVMRNLTNEEKDHLNIWNNLKDTKSEAGLYLRKFQSLPMKGQSILKHSLNDILNTFVSASLPPELSKAIGSLNKTDVEQIEALSKERQFHEMGHVIASRISNTDMSPSEMNAVYKFLYHIFAENNAE